MSEHTATEQAIDAKRKVILYGAASSVEHAARELLGAVTLSDLPHQAKVTLLGFLSGISMARDTAESPSSDLVEYEAFALGVQFVQAYGDAVMGNVQEPKPVHVAECTLHPK